LSTITDYIKDDSKENLATDAPNEESVGEEDGNGDDFLPKAASDTNFARRINRIWLDVHTSFRAPTHLFIPGMPTDYEPEEDFAIGSKRSHPGMTKTTRMVQSLRKPAAPPRSNNTPELGNDKGKTDAFENADPTSYWLTILSAEPRQDWCLWRHFAVLLEVKRDRSKDRILRMERV
jgi:hypothetical protein